MGLIVHGILRSRDSGGADEDDKPPLCGIMSLGQSVTIIRFFFFLFLLGLFSFTFSMINLFLRRGS